MQLSGRAKHVSLRSHTWIDCSRRLAVPSTGLARALGDRPSTTVISRLERAPETFVERASLAFLRHAPKPGIAIAARLAARSAAAKLEPGWHFDLSTNDPAPLVQFRRDVWQCYLERGLTRPVTHRWIDRLRVRSHLGNDLSLCLYVGGSFEPNEFVFLRSILQPGMTFIDGGANEGLYSLFAAKRVGRSGVVIAVEPSTREQKRIESNVTLNRQRNVRCRPVALGKEVGATDLAIASDSHGGMNTVGGTAAMLAAETIRQEPVAVTTIDALVTAEQLPRVDVIKLDIEGSEVDALEGAAATIAAFAPILLLEAEDIRLAHANRTKDDFFAVVDRYGYSLWVFDEKTAQLRAAVRPREPEGNVVAAPPGWTPPALA